MALATPPNIGLLEAQLQATLDKIPAYAGLIDRLAYRRIIQAPEMRSSRRLDAKRVAVT